VKVLVIAGLALRRLFRDRSNIFFVVIAPLLFIFVLGLLFGGGQSLTIGVIGADSGRTAERLVEQLAEPARIDVRHFDDHARLRTDVERGIVLAGLVIPPEADARLAAGEQVALRYLTRPDDPFAADLGVWVRAVVAQQAAMAGAAQVAAAESAGEYESHLHRVDNLDVGGVDVSLETTGESTFPSDLSPFAPMAPSLLLLFVFLTSLTAALGLIDARRLGVTRRMYASPTPVRTIVAGEALGRFGVALAQGLIIMSGSALLFGVNWGDPLGAAALLTAFCLVGSGAAMLVGGLFNNEGAALGAALGLGLGLAAAGGVMVPLEQLGDTARAVARFTPHSWAYEGFAELVRHGGTAADIGPQLGMLAVFAVVLFTLGVWSLRHRLLHPPT
jgi:ABC-2 type transport system permease protein